MRRKIISLLLVMTLCLSIVGCQKRRSELAATNLSAGVKAIPASAKATDEDFYAGYSQYALNMFKKGITADENSLVSPLSIIMALAMTANGAEGETLAQMEKVLGGFKIEDLNKYLYNYTNSVGNTTGKFSIANSIWVKNGLVEVREDFLATNKTYYNADAYMSAFDGQTVKDINNWVSDKTDGMIKQLLDKIDPDTFMFLINAICFDAKWAKIYEDISVRNGDFTCANGEIAKKKFMYSTEGRYLEGENYTGFIKSYEHEEYYFVALLPEEGLEINQFINNLPSDTFNKIVDSASTAVVHTSIPKFSYDYGLSLKDALKEMGIVDGFNKNAADFTKMCDAEYHAYIGDVIHKTFIEVGEQGTRAGAVTSVEMRAEGAMLEDKPKEVYLDRPFVYAIVDGKTQIPIFIGTLLE